MNGKVIIAAIVGIVVGGGAGFFGAKKYYEKIMDRDIAEVKAHYCVPKEKTVPDTKEAEKIEEVMPKPEEPEKPTVVKRPNIAIISPSEFVAKRSDPHYVETWTYWHDGTVTNEDGNVVVDYEDFIPADVGLHFGEYEEEVVYVRDYDQHIDYEVIYDERDYNDTDDFFNEDPD